MYSKACANPVPILIINYLRGVPCLGNVRNWTNFVHLRTKIEGSGGRLKPEIDQTSK
ncbi:hypothetical protein [Spirosoma flavus]